jgi:hypothetical protein
MHVFKAKPELVFSEKLELDIMSELNGLGVDNPKFHIVVGNPERNDSDKLRVTFTLRDKEKSLKVFKHYLDNPYLFEGQAKVAIFV